MTTFATALRTTTASTTTNGDWQDRAACQGMDSQAFFLPENARGARKRNAEAAAKEICATCPVIAQCLAYALSNEDMFGVWGGTTPEEREVLLTRRAVTDPQPMTAQGYSEAS